MNEYEIILHNKIKHINVIVNKIQHRDLHLHNDLELIYISEGSGSISTKLNKYEIKKGDVILLNAFEAHKINANKRLTCVIIQISNHFLREYYPSIRNVIFNEANLKNVLDRKAFNNLKELIIKVAYAYFKEDDLYELKCVGLLSDLLCILLTNVSTTLLSENEYHQKKRNSQRINRLLSYIESNYQNKISLKYLADSEHITDTHLSHIFSNELGISFQDYLNKIRLENALRLFSDSSLSLTDIAIQSGFSELKYLNKTFENRFNLKASKYREKNINIKNNDFKSEYIFSKEESLLYLENNN